MHLRILFILLLLSSVTGPLVVSAQIAQDDWIDVPQGISYRLPLFQNDIGFTAADLQGFSQPTTGQLQSINGILHYTAPSGMATAQFHYIVCNSGGVCDTAEVYLSSQPVIYDAVATQKQQAVYLNPQFYHSPAYSLVRAPRYGTVTTSSGDFRYLPDWSFTGLDTLLLRSNSGSMGSTFIHYRLEVRNQLPLVGNADYLQTPIQQPLQIQPLGNDLGQGLSINAIGLPQNGRAVLDANFPIISYTPDSSFTGLEQFDYTVCDATGLCQEVQIYIQVGNATHWLERKTAQNVALYEDFGAAVSSFTILTPPSYGQIFQATDTTLDHGISTRHYASLLRYTPQNNYTGLDYFRIAACDAGQCDTFDLSVEVLATHNCTDCVWPGDANNDGLVNAFDVLVLGSAYGANGPSRTSNAAWLGQSATDWPGSIPGYPGLNYKYADSNGDGLINEVDTLAIQQNYGFRHKNTLLYQAPLSSPEVQLIPAGPATAYTGAGGGWYQEFEIWLNGTVQTTATGIHGLYLQFQFDTSAVLLHTLSAQMLPNNFLSQGSYMLSMLQPHSNGQVDLAYTRTNNVAISAYGQLGNIGVVITDNIDGRLGPDSDILQLEHSVAIDDQGKRTELLSSLISSTLQLRRSDEKRRIVIYPQPATEVLHIQSLDGLPLQQLELFDLQGRRVYAENLNNQTQKHLSTSNLPAGMYVLRLYSEVGTLTQKVVVGN